MRTARDGDFSVIAFRRRLLLAMTLVAGALTLFVLYLAQRAVVSETQRDMRSAFDSELQLLRAVREIRHSLLAERCRALVRKPRIHAALEDDALDLLYPSAKEEIGDALPHGEPAWHSIRPRFYRFLDAKGAVIAPVNSPEVGALLASEEARLGLSAMPREQEYGYLARQDGEIVEIIATPILSTETGEPIAALVAGFPVAENERHGGGLRTGLWLDGRLHLTSIPDIARGGLEAAVRRAVQLDDRSAAAGVPLRVEGGEAMLFVECLNPGSLFPPAFEAGVFPLAGLLARQSELRWNAALAGAVLLCLGIAASYAISARLAAPVRTLAAVSAENRVLRERAETALEIKTEELQRAERFSADASHQLKTPVAVLRAGLDELLAMDGVSGEAREEVSRLVHQTYRLNSIIQDLLLLARLDSGRLQLDLAPLDVKHVVETCVDDMELLNDGELPPIETEIPDGLQIAGERRYTLLIVQNLLENARKYNRIGGRIRISAREEGDAVAVTVANHGAPIPPGSRAHIFERFHRGASGENVPGHGLGLNLARELARIHGGSLRLVRSDADWTEFEARFQSGRAVMPNRAAA